MILLNGGYLVAVENKVKVKSVFSPIPRVPTGIFGLDDMIEGGFEKGSINVVAGESGAGKSLFSLQFLYNGVVKYNDSALFISFEEKGPTVKRRMARFGFDIGELEAKGKFFMYDYSPKNVSSFIKDLSEIESVVKKNSVDRLVIDSLTSFSLFFDSEIKRKQETVSLFDSLRNMGCTVVLPSELRMISSGFEAENSFTIEHLADSIISIYSIRKGDIREMALEIIKMRGTNHSRKLSPFKILPIGMITYPDHPFLTK